MPMSILAALSKPTHGGGAALILALIASIGACGSTPTGKSDAASDGGGGAGDIGDGAGGRDAASDGDVGEGAGGRDAVGDGDVGERDDGRDAAEEVDVGDGGGGQDGAGDGDSDGAVEDAARGCDPSRPFGKPVPIDGLNRQSGHDGGAKLSADELTVYFFSDRLGAYDIFTATRTDRTAPFGTPQPIASLNTGAYDDFPSPTGDGLTMYIETNRAGSYQIMVASRSTLTAPFSEPVAVPNINAGPIEAFPYILPDNSRLYFTSNRSTGIGSYDLYVADRRTTGQFDTPVLVSTVNTTGSEWSPVPSFDELTIYFASDRNVPPAKGTYDIWMSRRSSKTANFDPPVNVEEVNSGVEDIPTWISPDNCRLYLAQFVTTGRRIYMAERAP